LIVYQLRNHVDCDDAQYQKYDDHICVQSTNGLTD